MLTNMENQLREQGATDRLDEVLEEIPRVREDLGFIPLVTPTSQIVGTQAVINVLMGERYKSIAKETAGVLRGEYGAALAPFNAELQARVLEPGEEAITCRPADQLSPELDHLTTELEGVARDKGIGLAQNPIDEVLIYALFPQVGLKFLQNRGNADAFEPAPCEDSGPAPAVAAEPAAVPARGPELYDVEVNGTSYKVRVSPAGAIESVQPTAAAAAPAAKAGGGENIPAPLAGNIFKIKVSVGQTLAAGDVIMILEAMKMETEVRAPTAGVVAAITVKEGDTVRAGDPLLVFA